MNTLDLLSRLECVCEVGVGWKARCPAHDDRTPSLAIAQGHNGRTLLNCWAGCTIENVVRVIGLHVADLFDSPLGLRRANVIPNRPTRGDARGALRDEAKKLVERLSSRGIHGELLTGEINQIRDRVSLKLGVSLNPVSIPLYEGGYGGRERDALWPVILEHAWRVTWLSLVGVAPLTLLDHSSLKITPVRSFFIAAEDMAAELMRGVERSSVLHESD